MVISGGDPTANLAPTTLGFTIATYVLAVTAVVLRFASRATTKAGFWWDDWFSLVGLAGCTIILVAIIIEDKHGLGQHWEDIGLGISDISEFLKLLYVLEVVYIFTLFVLKYSILAFYWRSIGTKSIRLPIVIAGILVMMWMLGSAFTSIFQCHPVSAAWNLLLRLSGDAHCIDIETFYLATAIPNIITDFFILLLPIPFIIGKRSKKTQIAVNCGFFILGSFVAICSGLRLRVLATFASDPLDVTWTFNDPIIWSALETNVGTVCICLPSLHWLTNMGSTPAPPSSPQHSDIVQIQAKENKPADTTWSRLSLGWGKVGTGGNGGRRDFEMLEGPDPEAAQRQ